MFEKGKSGNPGGRPKDKVWADAIRLAVNREDDQGRKKLHVLAEKLINEALAGESWAMQQIGDRLDGKPAQAIEGGDSPLEVIQRIERVIVNASNPDSESL